MARGGFDIGSIIKWGALLSGGYWLYTNYTSGRLAAMFSGAPAAAPPVPPPYTPPAPAPAPPASVPAATPSATLSQLLVAAAKNDPAFSNGTMNADQWNYYRNNLFPPALTGAQFTQAFPYVVSGDRNTQLTVDQFVAAIKAAGLGALGFGALPVRAHRVRLANGRSGLVWMRT